MPAVATWGPNRVDIFVSTTSLVSDLYHKYWDGTQWQPSFQGWDDVGGTMAGSPSVAVIGPEQLAVFVTGGGSDRSIY
jgi:hypothetical protein